MFLERVYFSRQYDTIQTIVPKSYIFNETIPIPLQQQQCLVNNNNFTVNVYIVSFRRSRVLFPINRSTDLIRTPRTEHYKNAELCVIHLAVSGFPIAKDVPQVLTAVGGSVRRLLLLVYYV